MFRAIIVVFLRGDLHQGVILRFLDHPQLGARERTHTHTHTHTVTIPWTAYQFVAKAATYTTHNKHKRRTSIPSAGFEPTIPAIKLLKT